MSLSSIYAGGTGSTFLQRVEVACLEIAREVSTNEAATVAHHDLRSMFARQVLTATDPSAYRRIGLLLNPGDGADQSVISSDDGLKAAIWYLWDDLAGVVN